MSAVITKDEWLAEIERLTALQPVGDDTVWTAEEIAAALHQDVRRVRTQLIRPLLATGRMVCRHKLIRQINGAVRRVSAYALVPTDG